MVVELSCTGRVEGLSTAAGHTAYLGRCVFRVVQHTLGVFGDDLFRSGIKFVFLRLCDFFQR